MQKFRKNYSQTCQQVKNNAFEIRNYGYVHYMT